MAARDTRGSTSEWREHCPLVAAACAGMALSTLISYSTGLFIEPLQAEFSWTRAEITSGQVIAATAGALLGPFVGSQIDRIGPRKIGIAACLLMCIATALLSLAGPSIWTWWALWIPLAASIVLIQPTVWTSAITCVFTSGRGLALAVTLCGSSIASLIIPPLTYMLIERVGWRLAYVLLPATWAIVVIPVIVLFFRTPLDSSHSSQRMPIPRSRSSMAYVFKDVVLTHRFITLAAAALSIASIVVTLAVSLVPVLSDYGLPRAQAAGTASLLGIASIAGRLMVGLALDRMPGRIVAACCVCFPVVALSLLLVTTAAPMFAIAAVLIIGLSLGAELDIVAYLTSRYFPGDNFGFLFGIVGGLVGIGAGFGPVAFSAVYDSTHSYDLALWCSIPLCLTSAILFLLLGPYPPSQQTTPSYAQLVTEADNI